MEVLIDNWGFIVSVAGIIGGLAVLKYRSDTNTVNITKLIEVVNILSTDVKLVNQGLESTKDTLKENAQNDKEKDKKVDDLRKEIYIHISEKNEKIETRLEGKIDNLRTKVQENSEAIAKK